MKPKYKQAAWEILAHLVSGTLLVLYIVAPNFRFLTWFLVIEYLIGVVNTVLWWTWLNSVDSTKQNNQIVAPCGDE